MVTVVLEPIEIVRDEPIPYLFVVANEYLNSRLTRTHQWRFAVPAHMADVFERAYIQCKADRVWWQETYAVIDDNGLFY